MTVIHAASETVPPDRLSVVQGFKYSDAERAEIMALVGTVGAAPGADVIRDAETIARGYLEQYIRFPETGKAARRAHYRAVAKAARTLYELLDDPVTLEGGSAAYLLSKGQGEGAPSGREFTSLVRLLAERSQEWSVEAHLPGAEPGAHGDLGDVPSWVVYGTHNLRTNMAHDLLKLFATLTGNTPAATRNGRAVRWLRATVNPAMKFARHGMNLQKAVDLTDEAAYETIRTVRG